MIDAITRAHLMCQTKKNLIGCYETEVQASDGTNIVGQGLAPDSAIDDAVEHLDAFEKFLTLPTQDQLRFILKADRGSLSQDNQERCIRLLAEIVLDIADR